MPKKKKTQQKPLDRGFAVTSIPKKAPVEQGDAKGEEPSTVETPDAQDPQHREPIEDEVLNTEERSLQDIVDKLQEKTEKEIVRTIKAIETERRFSDTFPLLDLDGGIVNEILELARDTQHGKANISDHTALARLGITYGVLRRLGYPEEIAERCLQSINGVDLEEAHEWLVHAESKVSTPKPKLTSALPTPTLSGPAQSSLPVQTPSSTRLAGEQRATPLSECDADLFEFPEFLDDDPSALYAKLRLELDKRMRTPSGDSEESFIEELRSRLSAVKSHYLFDQRDADAHYIPERQKLDKAFLQARLRGDPSPEVSKPSKPSRPDTQPHSIDLLDSNEQEDGGLFEILDDMPSTDISETGVTVRVRDMPLPKGKFERTSKAFLQAAVNKLDSFAVTTYHPLSSVGRAKRASLSIRWGSEKISEWTMTDVACYDTTQAEQYIATVALHALTFPTSAGFASGNSAPGSGPTFFRLLPPAYRELWDELEAARKSSDDATNRAVWAKLKGMVETRSSREKTVDESSRQPIRSIGNSILKNSREKETSAQIKFAFESRRSSSLYKEMLSQRNKLPIAQYRDRIVECLGASQVLVLSGETGCGKSTQLPAFILEDQLSRGNACKVYCAEPRRISAISLAHRVSQELGDPLGAVGTPASLVGYSVRLENYISRNTRLAYITYGIALRMLEGSGKQGENSIAFDEITHIIIDEVHERNIESDFLLIVLKALLVKRPDLRVVLMSATLDSEKLSHYFGGCPVIHVPGRTFPVDVKYLEDAVELTQWSITEFSPYAKRLNDKFFRGKTAQEWSEDTAGVNLSDHDDETTPSSVKLSETRYSPRTASTINLLDERPTLKYSAAILVFLPGIGEIRRLNDLLTEHASFGSSHDFVIYPLHSSISSENQSAVFEVPPPGVRKIVLATNIAETGITIPDITCVIDSGKHKEMRFDEKRQFSRLVETYVAKSNATQRRGRSGRVQDGLCFHLFTKIRHDTQLVDHPDPEIMRLSLSDLALRIKILKVDLGSSIEDVLSRALDPPLPLNVQRAVSALVEVRALTPDEEITPLGRLLSALPTDVHIGKFLLIATVFRCLDPALTIAATLNSKSPFLTPFGHEEEADRAKCSFRTDNSDFLTMHNAFSSWRRASSDAGSARKFCRSNFLSQQNLQQIEELRQQFLAYLIDAGLIQADRGIVKQLSRARFSRGRTRFVVLPPELDLYSENVALIDAALTAGLYPKILSIDPEKGLLQTVTNNRTVAFHPSSVNFRRKPLDFGVHYLAFFTIMHSKKLYTDLALLLLCGDCNFKLVSDAAFVDRKIRFRIPARTGLALKHLRTQLAAALDERLKNKPTTESQERWMDIVLAVLGKLRPEVDRTTQTVVLDVIRN
ncbi:P-loop containing nucleoside triphosphate hydrolase protein [Lactarius indigo]|nr:P-loop containing nucleoside triphosphate hydrolase protein [Lactarius indigo]